MFYTIEESDLMSKYFIDLKKKDLMHTVWRWGMICYGFSMYLLQRWIYYVPVVFHFVEQILGYSGINPGTQTMTTPISALPVGTVVRDKVL